MHPFIITASLLTPMVVGKQSVNLAGLIYHCGLMHTGSEDGAINLVNELLLCTDGIHHASNMTFGVSIDSPLIALTYKISGTMRQEVDLTKSRISPNGIKGKYKKIVLLGGVYKNRLESFNSHHCSTVHFYGAGNAEKITAMLNHYVNSLGVFSNRGAGGISSFTYEYIKNDHSFTMTMPNGTTQIMRSIPVGLIENESLEEFDIEDKVTTPPFYASKNQHLATKCVVPERILLTKMA